MTSNIRKCYGQFSGQGMDDSRNHKPRQMGYDTNSRHYHWRHGDNMRIHSTDSLSNRKSLHYEPAHPEGFHDTSSGMDLLLGNELICKYFPYLTNKAVAALHEHRAGWFERATDWHKLSRNGSRHRVRAKREAGFVASQPYS